MGGSSIDPHIVFWFCSILRYSYFPVIGCYRVSELPALFFTGGYALTRVMHYVSTMSVPCQYHVSTMSVPCQYHVSTMSIPCQYYVSTMSYTNCISMGEVGADTLVYASVIYWLVLAQSEKVTDGTHSLMSCTMSVPCQYHVDTMSIPCQYHVIH